MSSLALRRNRRTHFIPQLGEKRNGVCEVLSSIDVASYPLFLSLTWRYEWPLRTAEKLFWHDQVLMVRTCGTTGEPSRGMLKKADFSPAQPRLAKTRRSAGKAAADESAGGVALLTRPPQAAKTACSPSGLR